MAVKLDMSKFKKLSTDKHHTLLKHEDGHELKIAHKALSRAYRRDLEKLPMVSEDPKMADGGEVSENKLKVKEAEPKKEGAFKDAEFDQEKKKKVQEGLKKAFKFAEGGEVGADEQQPALPIASSPEALQSAEVPQQSPEMMEAPEAVPQQQPMADSAPTMPLHQQAAAQVSPDVMAGYNKQIEGINQQADAEAKMGVEQAALLKSQAVASQKLMNDYNTHFKDLENERQSFQQDITDKHVDPYRYFGNMNTGGQIATMVGLIMGGIGGGLTGQGNDALKYLNSQIDRDIDAQKAEIGKRETLLSANLKQFGNLKDATEMTKVMQADVISNQLKEAAARASSPIARARALEASGKIEAGMAPLVQQLATRRMLASGEGKPGSLSHVDPATLIPSIVPEHQQAEAFKELNEAKKYSAVRKNSLRAFDEIAKLNTLGSYADKGPIHVQSQINALQDPLVASLSKETAGRFTEQDAGYLKSLFPKFTDNAEDVAKKRRELANKFDEKAKFSVLSGHGLDPAKFESTAGQETTSPTVGELSATDKRMLNLARSYPNDPKAKEIFRKLGISE